MHLENDKCFSHKSRQDSLNITGVDNYKCSRLSDNANYDVRHKRQAESSGESRSKRIEYCEKEENNFSQATVYAADFNYQSLRGKASRPKHSRSKAMVDMLATQDIPSSSSCICIEIKAGRISLKNLESDKIMLE